MGGVSCVPLLPVNLVSFRGKRDVMINALFQNMWIKKVGFLMSEVCSVQNVVLRMDVE
jgi:hypothetical protein